MDRRVGLVLDPVFERHDTGPGHPECPQRLSAVRSHLNNTGLANRCVPVEPEEVAPAFLESVHSRSYIDAVERVCAAGLTELDPDTVAGPESPGIARLAAGSAAALCRSVAEGELDAGFAAVRPPGHHAERDRSSGFCLFNNIAVAAASLLARDDVQRVLIVDWDVHHGNGTQHAFEENRSVFYFSVHQFPWFPGTGRAEEVGSGEGAGFTLNRPLPAGSGDDRFLDSLGTDLVRAARGFEPDFVLVSAGFDAHREDPLAGLQVSTAAYGEATGIVRGIAARHASGRLVSVLEGGYHLRALPEAVAAHLEGLLAP